MNKSIVSHSERKTHTFTANWTAFDITIECTPAESVHTTPQQIHLANQLHCGLGPTCPRCGRPTWRANVRAYVDGRRLIAVHRDCNEVQPAFEEIEVYDTLTGITATGRGRYDLPEAAAVGDGLRRVRAEVAL